MGIDNYTALVVGVRRDELPPEGQEWLDDGDIEAFAPYYDGNSEDYTICGLVVIRTSRSKEVNLETLPSLVAKQMKQFTVFTGMVGRLYITLDIS